jgi:predicted RNA-binding protein (virulence factor B family)
MIDIGKVNQLEVAREVDFGVYLHGDEIDTEILLPKKYMPQNCRVGDLIDVFVYMDSEDRIIATTERPLAQVGEFAYLKVVSTTRFGAFLDWGLPKDLLVPFREQKLKMVKGKSYLVYIYVDEETDRIVASSKIDRWLGNKKVSYKNGQEVDLIIANKTSLGFNAVINNAHWGIIFNSDLFQTIKTGQSIKGFIKKSVQIIKLIYCYRNPDMKK